MKKGLIRIQCAVGTITCRDTHKKSLLKSFQKKLVKNRRSKIEILKSIYSTYILEKNLNNGLQVISGELSFGKANKKNRIIKAHNFDYDLYLGKRNNILSQERDYAVFIDQNLCYHPEYLYNGSSPFVTPEKYYPALGNGFREICRMINMEIKVAAHPRNCPQNLDGFSKNGITLAQGNTDELIANASLVIAHYSTALQLAILFRKPILFITTDELQNSPAKGYIEQYASSINQNYYNLENLPDLRNKNEFLNYNDEIYSKYISKYIKIKGSPELPLWDIVISRIEELDPKKCN